MLGYDRLLHVYVWVHLGHFLVLQWQYGGLGLVGWLVLEVKAKCLFETGVHLPSGFAVKWWCVFENDEKQGKDLPREVVST